MNRLPIVRRRASGDLRWIHFRFDGQALTALEGEPVAATLLASGIRVIRKTSSGRPRGIYCGIGHCYDCVATINGIPNQRTCLTPVEDGMEVKSEAP